MLQVEYFLLEYPLIFIYLPQSLKQVRHLRFSMHPLIALLLKPPSAPNVRRHQYRCTECGPELD